VNCAKRLLVSCQIRHMNDAGNAKVKTSLQVVCLMYCAVCVFLALGCARIPPMERQERMIQENKILVHQLTAPAFVHAWGQPSYHHSEYSSFFVLPDRTMVPRSRVPLGESPEGWESGADADEAVFFAYPDRGWLLVFVEEKLVYREELKADKLHALGKSWEYEDRFKTRLD